MGNLEYSLKSASWFYYLTFCVQMMHFYVFLKLSDNNLKQLLCQISLTVLSMEGNNFYFSH